MDLMHRRITAIVLAVVALTFGGCDLLPRGPVQIDCTTVEPAVCQRIAQGVLTQKKTENPARRPVKLVVMDPRGSYDLTYDDGSGESMIVD